ncbi:LutC/YkgG family protein [Atopobacter phocae]|uniref:LutC/YkgG family protein n=1 Tax=Atopobacter phocae TaxID=136492 RepID=UPI0004709E58|nr:lactate utilization protein C [Atopobacter phocae]
MTQTGQIYNRDKFLDHLKNRLSAEPYEPYQPFSDLPERQLDELSIDELVEVAKKQSQKVKAEVVETTHSQLNQTIEQVIQTCEAGQIIIPNDKQFDEYGVELSPSHAVYEWKIGPEFRDENITAAEKSNIAIAFAQYFLAESASVVVETTPGQGRTLHFLPTHYIAIVPKSRIVKRSTQAAAAFDARGNSIGSAIHFISGPSNSGDIEMQLVTGLHGPLRVFYIIVDDL